MEIKLADLDYPPFVRLIEEHTKDMYEDVPEEYDTAIDMENLPDENVTFWSVFDGDQLAGCGALKELGATHGEIKSIKTHPDHLQKGVASLLMDFLTQEAQRRGYTRLSLETGTTDDFIPARALYEKLGFTYCKSYLDGPADPESVFMTKVLDPL